MNVLYDFLEWTAWEMVEPKPYGLFHILFTLVGGGFSLWAAYKLRNVGEREHRLILLAVGLILAISELYKQLFHTFYLNDGAYKWSILPFQLCSVPMYLCLILAVLPRGICSETMETFLGSYNMLGGLMSFVVPSGLCHEYWTLTLHAFVWHMLLVFLGLYLTVSGRGHYDKKSMRRATVLFVLLCWVAIGINVSLGKVSHGAVNMFYLGPPLTPQPVFKIIALYVGWEINALLYMGCIIIGAYVVSWGMTFLKKMYSSKRNKKEMQYMINN